MSDIETEIRDKEGCSSKIPAVGVWSGIEEIDNKNICPYFVWSGAVAINK